jgi:uncharacterized protein YjbI with pentapeptide repeats
MANEEQLSILRQGVEVWNKWREEDSLKTIRINLSGVDFADTDLQGINFRHASLEETNFFHSNLSFSDLHESNLYKANMQFARLTQADLSGASLNKANLRGARMANTNLDLADLTNADLVQSHLFYTHLSNTFLKGAIFSAAELLYTFFGSTDLSEVIGLESVRHFGLSFVSLEAIRCSLGKIPEVFLRGCGLNDLEIEFAKLAKPDLGPEQVTDITYKIHQLYLSGGIQYYSCFISYSSKDQEFAQLLHDDLQNSGVRCWFDREDLKIGDRIRPTIDSQIQLRDKLLVILSENSVKSEWVGDEVEGALEEESKSNRLVLFPIRLDDTVLNTRDNWAAKIKRRRHIGDFSNWKDKNSYQKAFERLLRDLKASSDKGASQ